MLFAVLLLALTLGINVVLPKAEANGAVDTAQEAPPAQVAQTAQVN